ncbi:hypothetical protein J3458_021285 [Metarhizium acridum]|uniref:uncharacterized protein n=1 Tax=Metarhizium acridum TaxID=92637 RepID=UPI001C6B649B|nr:hypothetical protein J3458_021285 [Metarhizium acridum]
MGDYCGGTFQGLQAKLDYIRGMGFDAIWNHLDHPSGGQYRRRLSRTLGSGPLLHQRQVRQRRRLEEPRQYRPRKGTPPTSHTSRNLLTAPKQMYVMVDVVANHMGPSALPSSTKARHITPPAKSTTRTRRPSRTAKYMYGFIAKVLDVKKSAGGLAGDDHAHLFVDSTAYA